jgi:apolipoprotein N-acyltransferase
LALYFGLFGFFITNYQLPITSYQLIFAPSAWVLLEYIRSCLFTGFPWALLGYSQYLNLPVIQIADITGAWGVSFLVMLVNVVIYLAASGQRPAAKRKKECLLFLILILSILSYGYYKIYHLPFSGQHLPVRVSLIQGNIPQELKWKQGTEGLIISKYIALTERAARDNPDLIIWPEAAFPSLIEEGSVSYGKVVSMAGQIKAPLLLGAVRLKNSLYYNSAVLISGQGKEIAVYDKLHLVPFGEYIPLRKLLPFLETIAPIGDIAGGKEYTVFSCCPVSAVQCPLHFSVLICFEDLFPGLSRRFVNKGAGFLVNITNDAWYKKTSASGQHLQASAFRALENRVFLVRAANTGISAFIAPSGKITAVLADAAGNNIFVPGYLTGEIASLAKPRTFYSRYGDIFIFICFLFFACGIIAQFRFKSLR